MKLSCTVSKFLDIADNAVVLFCHKSSVPNSDLLEQIDILSGGAVAEMYESGEFNGADGSAVMIRRVPETAAGRIVLAGLGESKNINFDTYRRAAGHIGKMMLKHKVKSVTMYYDGTDTNPIAQALVEGCILGTYRFLDYKTGDKDKNDGVDSLTIAVPQGGKLKQAQTGLDRADIVAWAVNMCRDLTFLPGNTLYPESYAKRAEKLAKECGFKCTILGPSEIKKEKMDALYSVGKGSDRPPRFVILEYNGKPKSKPVVLVGKGVTFDSGGISLKPGLNMQEMIGDMMGSAVVLSVICAAARLGVKMNIVALMPLAENMPSGGASKPGDIINSRAGHTIEIINTDAEGRLILADALDYADTFDPQAVIDIATLTGASLYILGYAGAPFVGTSQNLNNNLRAVSETIGEKVWELPLWSEYSDLMKSSVADIKNSGGRPAGTLSAAAFLKKFTKDWPWAHIDIAYCDIEPSGKPYTPKGATGYGVRLLLELLQRWKRP
ncbi:MAG: leucyl aminopeptidase [FCB group bacterium]|nr:leucyl aminopeptidase [FCB group bacterium]